MFDFKGEHILTAHTIPAAIDLHHGLDKREGGGGGGGIKNIVWGSIREEYVLKQSCLGVQERGPF